MRNRCLTEKYYLKDRISRTRNAEPKERNYKNINLRSFHSDIALDSSVNLLLLAKMLLVDSLGLGSTGSNIIVSVSRAGLFM